MLRLLFINYLLVAILACDLNNINVNCEITESLPESRYATKGSNLEQNAVLLHQLESGTRDTCTMYDYACFVVSSLYTNDFIESSCLVKGIKLVNHYR